MLRRSLGLFLALTFIPSAAFAYIGPGAGLSAIGTLVAVVGAILLAIVGFIWYPVKRMLKNKKSKASAQDGSASEPADNA